MIEEAQESWRDSLPEGFADAPFFKAAETPEAALAEIQNAASYMGNSIRIPGEDASDEARNEFYTKVAEKAKDKLMFRPDDDSMDAFYDSLGRPKDPKEYKIELPDGREIPADFESFSKIAHENGLSNKQFKGILSKVLEEQWTNQDINDIAQKEEFGKLAKEWGVAFDNNIGQVKNFLLLTDAPEGIVELISEGAMSTTEIKWLHDLATKMRTGVELAAAQSKLTDVMTPAEAREKIGEMMNNDKHPYWVANDPRHNDAIQKMLKLQAMANPGPR